MSDTPLEDGYIAAVEHCIEVTRQQIRRDFLNDNDDLIFRDILLDELTRVRDDMARKRTGMLAQMGKRR